MGLRFKPKTTLGDDSPRAMTFMDKLSARIKQAAKRTTKAAGSLLPDYNTYVAVRTSPKFQGTFSPLRPLARITPNRWRVLDNARGPNRTMIQRERQCQTPTRDGFLGALPLMFGKRSDVRRAPKTRTAH
jgi:hypothetical protein